jgi:hypothetical protein
MAGWSSTGCLMDCAATLQAHRGALSQRRGVGRRAHRYRQKMWSIVGFSSERLSMPEPRPVGTDEHATHRIGLHSACNAASTASCKSHSLQVRSAFEFTGLPSRSVKVPPASRRTVSAAMSKCRRFDHHIEPTACEQVVMQKISVAANALPAKELTEALPTRHPCEALQVSCRDVASSNSLHG